jgi:hypothetical protein
MSIKSKSKESSFAKPVSMLLNTYAETIDADELEQLKEKKREEISSGIRELWRKLNSAKDRKVFHTLSNDLDECLTLVTHLWVLDNESRSTLEELLQQEVRKRIENDINSQLNSLAN